MGLGGMDTLKAKDLCIEMRRMEVNLRKLVLKKDPEWTGEKTHIVDEIGVIACFLRIPLKRQNFAISRASACRYSLQRKLDGEGGGIQGPGPGPFVFHRFIKPTIS